MKNNENRHGYWHIASCAKQLSLNNSEFIVIFLFEFFDPSSMQLFVADGFIDWEEVSARIAENPNIKCEYEQQQDTVIGIGKRMTERYDWWKANTNDKLVLNIVKNGYELPFDATPQRKNCKNSQSAYEHEAFVTEAIQELVKAGSAIKIQEQPHIVAALSVDDKKPDKSFLNDKIGDTISGTQVLYCDMAPSSSQLLAVAIAYFAAIFSYLKLF